MRSNAFRSADRQRIEILKALALGARILILDEPDGRSDGRRGRAACLALVRQLAADGLPIVLITHKLREVMQAADRVSTLRRGRMVMAGVAVNDVDAARLSEANDRRRDRYGAAFAPGSRLGARPWSSAA